MCLHIWESLVPTEKSICSRKFMQTFISPFSNLTWGGNQITTCFPSALSLHPTFPLLNLDDRYVFLHRERTEWEDSTFHKGELSHKHHSDKCIHKTQVVSGWTCVFSVTEKNNILSKAYCFLLRSDGWEGRFMFYLRTKWTKDTAVEKPKMNMCCLLGMRKYI